MSSPTYTRQVLERLSLTYPSAKIALTYSTPWELLVSVILSAQCTDIMVNKVTEKLFKKYPTLEDYVFANPEEFERDIKSTGFFRNKAKNILATAKIIKTTYGGSVPTTMEELTKLPGVARKTANIVLSNAFHTYVGIAVDTHVHRISQRLRLVDLKIIGGKREIPFVAHGKTQIDFKKDADPNKIEAQLMRLIPKDDWYRFTYMIIDHGRAVCKAPVPKCNNCVLRDLCPASRV